jgi:hypothetical protein
MPTDRPIKHLLLEVYQFHLLRSGKDADMRTSLYIPRITPRSPNLYPARYRIIIIGTIIIIIVVIIIIIIIIYLTVCVQKSVLFYFFPRSIILCTFVDI